MDMNTRKNAAQRKDSRTMPLQKTSSNHFSPHCSLSLNHPEFRDYTTHSSVSIAIVLWGALVSGVLVTSTGRAGSEASITSLPQHF